MHWLDRHQKGLRHKQPAEEKDRQVAKGFAMDTTRLNESRKIEGKGLTLFIAGYANYPTSSVYLYVNAGCLTDSTYVLAAVHTQLARDMDGSSVMIPPESHTFFPWSMTTFNIAILLGS